MTRDEQLRDLLQYCQERCNPNGDVSLDLDAGDAYEDVAEKLGAILEADES